MPRSRSTRSSPGTIEQNLDLRLRDIDSTLKWLEGQLVSSQAKLQAAENAMADYRQQQNALSLDRGSNILERSSRN